MSAGVVTAEQAAAIEAMHLEQEGAAGRRFLTILTMLGGALCVIGIALIISANWQEIHRWVKIIGLLLLMAAAYGGGFRLQRDGWNFPRLGGALLVAGCVMLLLGIALVSQIFHLDGRPGDAVLIWIAGILPVPFLTRARGAFFVLLLAVYSWLCIETTAHDGWLGMGTGSHSSRSLSLPFVLLCGSLMLHWMASLWRTTWRDFAEMQRAWALVVICATVYAAGFVHKGSWVGHESLLAEPAGTVIGVTVLAAGLAARQNWNAWRMLSPWLILAAAPALIAFGGFLGADGRMACAVASWVTLVVLNVFMARAGLAEGKPWLVNTAIAFIALNLFTRYFDIFSSMLDQGVMFLVSGAVVLGVGWYLERKRRALLGMMKRGGAL